MLFGFRSGHQALFLDLCRHNEIDRKTRHLLGSVMQQLQPDRPAVVFLDPQWLQKAMQLDEFQESLETLNELYQKWFVES